MSEPGPAVPAASPGYTRFPQLAGFGQRLIGRILDNVVLLAPLMLWAYFLREPGASAATSEVMFYLLILGFSFANDVALTALTGGSVGKLICGTRMVHTEGWRPITMGTAMIRWFVMVVLNVIPFGGIADALFIFSGELKQTLHDRAAGTTVVRAVNR